MKRGHSCVRPGSGRPTGGLPGGRLWMGGSRSLASIHAPPATGSAAKKEYPGLLFLADADVGKHVSASCHFLPQFLL